MAWKYTSVYTFHGPVKKFRVAKMPEGADAVFVSIGPGGKGSECEFLSPAQALDLARYLTVEAHKALEGTKKK
jgi:hypothetical protein